MTQRGAASGLLLVTAQAAQPSLAGRSRNSAATGEALVRRQTAWIAYRDSQCRLAYEMMMPGSGAGDAANDCNIRLTRERNRAPQAMVE